MLLALVLTVSVTSPEEILGILTIIWVESPLSAVNNFIIPFAIALILVTLQHFNY